MRRTITLAHALIFGLLAWLEAIECTNGRNIVRASYVLNSLLLNRAVICTRFSKRYVVGWKQGSA
jgi:hypothetical protein